MGGFLGIGGSEDNKRIYDYSQNVHGDVGSGAVLAGYGATVSVIDGGAFTLAADAIDGNSRVTDTALMEMRGAAGDALGFADSAVGQALGFGESSLNLAGDTLAYSSDTVANLLASSERQTGGLLEAAGGMYADTLDQTVRANIAAQDRILDAAGMAINSAQPASERMSRTVVWGAVAIATAAFLFLGARG